MFYTVAISAWWNGRKKLPAYFPDDTIHVFIEMVDDKTRRLKIANI